jgi:hypothetical protein
MHGSRNKIPSKNLVRERCAEGFISGVKGLIPVGLIHYFQLEECFIVTEFCNEWNLLVGCSLDLRLKRPWQATECATGA